MTGYRPALGVEQYLQTSVATSGLDSSRKTLRLGDEFPMVCETCLGPNPYVRMQKLRVGDKLCKMSNVAFQAFRWKAGAGRFKETIVCKEVALEKNVCQACLSDLTYGVPVGVRDALLKKEDDEPVSDVNQAYYYASSKNSESRHRETTAPSRELLGLARSLEAANAATRGTAFRNLKRLCSFWVRGDCSRVGRNTCPFRPCCGEFKFPELAATHPPECAALVEGLRAYGPLKVMTDPNFAATKTLLKEATSGFDRSEAVKNRLKGTQRDPTTQRYLSRMAKRHGDDEEAAAAAAAAEESSSSEAARPALRPDLAAALAAVPTNRSKRPRNDDDYPSMDPRRLGSRPPTLPRPPEPPTPPPPSSLVIGRIHDAPPPPPPGPPPPGALPIPPPPPGPPPPPSS